jgi:myosin heavy subunit
MADDFEYEYYNQTEEDDYLDGRSNRRSNNQDDEEEERLRQQNEEDDEQQQQKLNGKLELLQQRIDQLELEIVQERQSSLEMKQKYDGDLQEAMKQLQSRDTVKPSTANAELQQLQNDVKKWKAKCENVQEKLEMALITNPNSSAMNQVPLQLQDEFLKYCSKYNQLPDLQTKTLTLEDCLKVFQNINTSLKKKNNSNTENAAAKPKSSHRTITDSETNSDNQSATEKLAAYHQHHKLNDKIKNLEDELKLAANHADDISNLKNRVMQLSERIRQEKEYKRTFELEGISLKKKVEMLSDHIEKLILHIKREGAQKLKFAENMKLFEKENQRLKEKYEVLSKKVSIKDRLIFELREGSKVLEDQLKLMDEKYLELRNKLDYARYMAQKKIKKAEKAAADLRVKWAALGGNVPMDSFQFPPPSSSSVGGGSDGGLDAFSVQSGSLPGRLTKLNSNPSMLMRSNTNRNSDQFDSSSDFNRNKLQLNLEAGMMDGNGGGMASMQSMHSMHSSMTMKTSESLLSIDSVLEKIRVQQGNKTEWTEDKARKLVKYHP